MSIIRYLIFTLLYCAINTVNVHAQDFSNKGKEFWLVFPPHQPSSVNTLADLSLYISSDKIPMDISSLMEIRSHLILLRLPHKNSFYQGILLM